MTFPGADEDMLNLRKNLWFSSIGMTIAITGMTFLGWVLDLPLIVWYGIVLLIGTVPTILLVPFIRKHLDWIFFSIQFLLIWVTFYFMLKLGGLLNSAGLMFSGEEKNCEKAGSCAIAASMPASTKQIITVSCFSFFICCNLS